MQDLGENYRKRLGEARLLLIFSPELVSEDDPLERLRLLIPHVDIIQVRPKPVATEQGAQIAADPPAEARATHDWAERVIELVAEAAPDVETRPLVMVNDRVDVAMALRDRGCAGVHLGQSDLPTAEARSLLGEDAIIGLSTHSMSDVAMTLDQPIDYLGYGPVFASTTKGYSEARGPETAWVASEAVGVPLFPIGGITPANATELKNIGRAAVGSALLSAKDPVEAALTLRAALEA